MTDLNKIKERLLPIIKNKYFLFVMILILLVFAFVPNNNHTTYQSQQETVENAFDPTEFENKLSEIIAQIRGVKSAKVLLTYEGGTQYIYAQDINETESEGRKTSTKDTVIAGGEAIVIGSVNPKITGAVVVYTGTRSASVKLEVTQAVMSATALSSDKITVLYGG